MIFISYAREDARAAHTLEAHLSKRGVATYRDPSLAESDPFWRELIAAALTESTGMIALNSDASDGSPWVEQERRAFSGPVLEIDVRTPRDGSEWERPAFWRALDALNPASGAGQKARGEVAPHIRAARIADAKQQADECVARLGQALEPTASTWVNPIDGGQFIQVGKGFWIGSTPVTNAQFARFLADSGREPPPTWAHEAYRDAEQPVTGVSWFDARCYSAWAGGRLPREEEWETAARSGTIAALHATASGAIAPEQADYARPFAQGAPLPARACPPTPAGLYGMCGGVWDWCETLWGEHRVLKGGGFMDAAAFCAIAARYRNAETDRDCCVGFRVGMSGGP